jgi:hypothetical protein
MNRKNKTIIFQCFCFLSFPILIFQRHQPFLKTCDQHDFKKIKCRTVFIGNSAGGGWRRLSQYPTHLFFQRGKQEDGSEKAEFEK